MLDFGRHKAIVFLGGCTYDFCVDWDGEELGRLTEAAPKFSGVEMVRFANLLADFVFTVAPVIKQRWGWDRPDTKDLAHTIDIRSTSRASAIAFNVLTEPDFRPVSISVKYAR